MSWLPWKFREVLISILEEEVILEANGFIEGNILNMLNTYQNLSKLVTAWMENSVCKI